MDQSPLTLSFRNPSRVVVGWLVGWLVGGLQYSLTKHSTVQHSSHNTRLKKKKEGAESRELNEREREKKADHRVASSREQEIHSPEPRSSSSSSSSSSSFSVCVCVCVCTCEYVSPWEEDVGSLRGSIHSVSGRECACMCVCVRQTNETSNERNNGFASKLCRECRREELARTLQIRQHQPRKAPPVWRRETGSSQR